MADAPAAKKFDFKFHWLNDKGQATTVFARKGSLAGDVLSLEESSFPVAVIAQCLVVEQRMVLAVATGKADEPFINVLLQLSSKSVAEELKGRIDRTRSRHWSQVHKQELEQQGRGHAYRGAVCPECDAAIVLSDMVVTPQVYCHYCDSLASVNGDVDLRKQERSLKLCQECGMYAQPRQFTIFYFYFLLVVYGIWHKRTFRCPACMRRDAWKMLFGNMLFVLGTPVAIWQLARCYGGGWLGGRFAGLDRANIRAKQGDVGGALSGYKAILDRVPHSAGVKYNLALALLQQGDEKYAADTLELALADCSNYSPAYHRLSELYRKLGEDQKLQALERAWSSGVEEEAKGEAADEEDVREVSMQ